jgi:hypothetical protein
MLNVAFYEPTQDRIVHVEPFRDGMKIAREVSLHLTLLWASGRHSLPSPYWVAWDRKKRIFSLFVLDQTLTPDEELCERIRLMVGEL